MLYNQLRKLLIDSAIGDLRLVQLSDKAFRLDYYDNIVHVRKNIKKGEKMICRDYWDYSKDLQNCCFEDLGLSELCDINRMQLINELNKKGYNHE